MIKKKCVECDREFKVHNYRKKTARFCSSECYRNNWTPPKNAVKIKKGQRLSRKTEFKKGEAVFVGENHPGWRGDKVSYGGLHAWIKRKKGKPTTCEHCGQTGLTGKKIHWASVDHNYKRDAEDYIRLCMSCHEKYDFAKGHR